MKQRRIVFTKIWNTPTIDELGKRVAGLGLDGVELPVRPGFQVTPDRAFAELPTAAAALRSHGVEIVTIASEPTEAIIRACGAAGVPTIRTMARIDMTIGYRESVKRLQEEYQRLTPLLLDAGVRIGVQNHCGYYVGSAVGLIDLVAPLDPKAVGIVLDFAHCALEGEPVDMAIEICGDRTILANFKSAYRRRTNGLNAEEAEWKIDWTTAKDSLYSWKRAVAELAGRGYAGDYCLCAEYSTGDGSFLEGDAVLPLLRSDIDYLDRLIGGR
jgi:sugar phosphate isomerase/epimerase